MKRLTIDGNTKLGDQVGVFNLPPKKTCTPTEWCMKALNGKPRCYGLRGNCRFSNVIRACNKRLKESKKPDFVERMIYEIRTRFRYFRIHALGDYYSDAYVRKWVSIVRGCPDTLFMTTTRRRDLVWPLTLLSKEPNIVVRESLDMTRMTPVMGFPAAVVDDIELFVLCQETDLIRCPGKCEPCNYTCWKDHRWVMFPVH